jgi:hypothetical protein
MIGLNEREVRDAMPATSRSKKKLATLIKQTIKAMSAVSTESKARNVEVVGNIGACRINQKDNRW